MIEGDAVTLRPMTPADIDIFLRWVNDPSASPFWYGRTRPVTREDLPGDWEGYYFDSSRARHFANVERYPHWQRANAVMDGFTSWFLSPACWSLLAPPGC